MFLKGQYLNFYNLHLTVDRYTYLKKKVWSFLSHPSLHKYVPGTLSLQWFSKYFKLELDKLNAERENTHDSVKKTVLKRPDRSLPSAKLKI